MGEPVSMERKDNRARSRAGQGRAGQGRAGQGRATKERSTGAKGKRVHLLAFVPMDECLRCDLVISMDKEGAKGSYSIISS